MEPRFSSLATALEGTQALASLFILLLNNLLCNPVKMITSQIKKMAIFSTERIFTCTIKQVEVGKIKDYLKYVKSTLHAVQFKTLLSGLSWHLSSKLIPAAKKFPLPSLELLVTLAWTPLVALDVAVQVCLLAYTMAFQCALYLLYVGLFVLCHLVGDHSKLEKTGLPQRRIVVKPRVRENIVNDACRTFTFFNMDSYIFNDVETEEEEKMRAFSDESGYLSESELLVDDSF